MNTATTSPASRIEHTRLTPETTASDIDRLCDEAASFGFVGVCVNPVYVRRAVERLDHQSGPHRPIVVTVAGFPLGAVRSESKADQARRALDDGASEIDMVIHVGALIDGEHAAVRRDIEIVVDAVRASGDRAKLKVILETAALSEERIVLGCRCAAEAGADYVKTSTGMHASGGATVEAVRLLHRHASPLLVKAAGGIRSAEAASAMIDAGAARIGTSAGVAIVKQLDATR